jgi:signal transduction histidine kinase
MTEIYDNLQHCFHFLANTFAAMVGGRDVGDISSYQTVSRHLMALVFGGVLLLLSSRRYAGGDKALLTREKAIVWGFSLGMLREFTMLTIKTLTIVGVVAEVYVASYYPIIGHWLRILAEIVISGAFLIYYVPKGKYSKHYIKVGATFFTVLTILFILIWRFIDIGHGSYFGESPYDIVWHGFALIFILIPTIEIAGKGFKKHWILLTSFTCFIMAHLLSLINSIQLGVYDVDLIPLMYGFDVWAIPIIGFVYLKEQNNLVDLAYEHTLAYEKLRADDNQTIIQGISHELRSPMAGLVGLLHAYQRKFLKLQANFPALDATVDCVVCVERKLLTEIFEALNTFQVIVSNLSDILNNLSNYGKNIRQHTSSPQDVKALLVSAVDFVRFADSSKKLDYSAIQYIDNSNGLDAIVNIAPSKFLQIIQNIAENAIASVKEKPNTIPRITLSITVNSTMVIISIEDNGVGIARNKLKICRERGYTTKSERGNTGLGLYFVNVYLREIEGSLDIKSEEGLGALMTIYLPRSLNFSLPSLTNL